MSVEFAHFLRQSYVFFCGLISSLGINSNSKFIQQLLFSPSFSPSSVSLHHDLTVIQLFKKSLFLNMVCIHDSKTKRYEKIHAAKVTPTSVSASLIPHWKQLLLLLCLYILTERLSVFTSKYLYRFFFSFLFPSFFLKYQNGTMLLTWLCTLLWIMIRKNYFGDCAYQHITPCSFFLWRSTIPFFGCFRIYLTSPLLLDVMH